MAWQRWTTDGVLRAAVVAIAVVVVASALNFAAVAAVPIVVSLVLTLMLWPLRQWLCRFIWSWASALLCSLLLLVGAGAVLGWGWYAADSAAEEFSASQEQYIEQYQEFRQWLTGNGVPEESVPEMNGDATTGAGEEADDAGEGDAGNSADSPTDASKQPGDTSGASELTSQSQHGTDPRPLDAPTRDANRPAMRGAAEQPEPARNGRWEWVEVPPRNGESVLLNEGTRGELFSIAVGGMRSAVGVLAALLLTLFMTFLALFEGDRWAQWAHEHLRKERVAALSELVDVWSRQTRWYFIAKAIAGLVSGTLTAGWLWFMDVPLAIIFGVFTLFMNFVPNVGALISGLPPTVLAIVQLGWTQGLIVAGGLIVIEAAVGNLIDPYFQGRMLSLSTWVVLASLIFWGWMWGIVGAVLAAVLTSAIIATLMYHQEDGEKVAQGFDTS
jgi:AI-2 transport protein TqsA